MWARTQSTSNCLSGILRAKSLKNPIPDRGGSVKQKDTTVGGKNLGFIADKGRFVASRQFLAANPAAKRWFELVQLPFEDIITQEKLAHEGQNRSKDIRRHAEEWVNNHQALVDGWLEEARIAGKVSK